MAFDTDTLPTETSTTAREAQRPRKAGHGPLTWAAVVGACVAVVALAVAALAGQDKTDDAPAPTGQVETPFLPGLHNVPTG
jgi:hypothetical protein